MIWVGVGALLWVAGNIWLDCEHAHGYRHSDASRFHAHERGCPICIVRSWRRK